MAEINVYHDADELSGAVAERVANAAAEAIAAHGRFVVAVAGGSTPRGVYERLASPGFADGIDWPHVHVFWGDERCVPPDDLQSNFGMVRDALLSTVPVPESNVHRIEGELGADEAAARYERTLHAFFVRESAGNAPAARPRFDLVVLGVGEDGHTASLFPGDPALNEEDRWVVAVGAPDVDPRVDRVTLTLPVINAAERVYFVVTGPMKQNVCRSILDSPSASRVLYPAAMVRPEGELVWFLDRAAAGQTQDKETLR
jgi:6-phosphogluconolactonase